MTDAPLYLYLDVETPGLDPKMPLLEVGWGLTTDLFSIEEVASKVTNADYSLAYSEANAYVRQMHTDSGLWEELKAGQGSPVWSIEQEILSEIGGWTGPVYLVGNSIRLDRAFIEEHMPRLDDRLHYRQIDLTSVRLFLEGKGLKPMEGVVRKSVTGESMHRAFDDIIDSADMAQNLSKAVDRELNPLTVTFRGGPMDGMTIQLPRTPKSLRVGFSDYSAVVDPETGEHLGLYLFESRD